MIQPIPSFSLIAQSGYRLGRYGLHLSICVRCDMAHSPWLYLADIFPLAVQSKGNAWGVVGWSIGNGWLVSVTFFDDESETPVSVMGSISNIDITVTAI